MCIYMSVNLFRSRRSVNQTTRRTLFFSRNEPQKTVLVSFEVCAMGSYRILTILGEQNGNEQCLNSVKTKLAVIFWRNCRKPLYYKLWELFAYVLATWRSATDAGVSIARSVDQFQLHLIIRSLLHSTKFNKSKLPTNSGNKQPSSHSRPTHTMQQLAGTMQKAGINV